MRGSPVQVRLCPFSPYQFESQVFARGPAIATPSGNPGILHRLEFSGESSRMPWRTPGEPLSDLIEVSPIGLERQHPSEPARRPWPQIALDEYAMEFRLATTNLVVGMRAAWIPPARSFRIQIMRTCDRSRKRHRLGKFVMSSTGSTLLTRRVDDAGLRGGEQHNTSGNALHDVLGRVVRFGDLTTPSPPARSPRRCTGNAGCFLAARWPFR